MGNETTKKLNFKVSGQAYQDLQALSKKTRLSMTELVRYGIVMVKIAVEVAGQGNKLVVASDKGKVLREIVLPRP